MSDEALNKTGPELFKELLRIYETAEFEDYLKGGQWKDDLMKMDFVLIEAHRKEAGAPDPPALEEVVMPVLNAAPVMGQLGQWQGTPILTVPKVGVAIPKASTVAGSPVAELRLIALFCSKWQLEPAKTKMTMARLTPHRRRYVMQYFKVQGGGTTNEQLEAYIAECEKSGDWDNGQPAGGTAPAATVVAGVKRPFQPLVVANPALEAMKRQRIMASVVSPVRAAAPAMIRPAVATAPSLAARLAAARAAGGMSPRPASPRPILTVGNAAMRPISPLRPGAGMMRPIQPVAGKGAPGSVIRNLLGRM